MRSIVLDNDAVQALADPTHAKHRGVLAHLEGIASRRRKGRAVRAVVPTAVRVEAGWDRSTPSAAAINRFRVEDWALDSRSADVAATIMVRTRVGVAEAHIGAVVRDLLPGDVVVLSSDPDHMRLVSAPAVIRAVRI